MGFQQSRGKAGHHDSRVRGYTQRHPHVFRNNNPKLVYKNKVRTPDGVVIAVVSNALEGFAAHLVKCCVKCEQLNHRVRFFTY